jgi:hypothetical protein
VVSWEFANFQAPGINDQVEPGNGDRRVNGNAVLLVEYSDGTSGILGIGCHGPGAPGGIVEGVIATKEYLTFWDAEPPDLRVPNTNRTIFHFE